MSKARRLTKNECLGLIAGIELVDGSRVVGKTIDITPGSFVLAIGDLGRIIEVPKKTVRRLFFSIKARE